MSMTVVLGGPFLRKHVYFGAAAAFAIGISIVWLDGGCTGCDDYPYFYFQAETGTHTSDPCVATLTGTRGLRFDFPAYCSDCGAAVLDAGTPPFVRCEAEDDGGPTPEFCTRDQHLIQISARPTSAQSVFDALGSSSLTLSVTCAGEDLSDGSISGFSETKSCAE